MREIVIALLLTCAAQNMAQAQTLSLGRTTPAEPSVQAVLERNRCDPMWYSQTLQDSGLRESQGTPALGTEIVLKRVLSCKLPAPQPVAARSKALLESSPAQLKLRPAASAPAKKRPPPQPPELERLRSENSVLKAENENLSQERDVLKREREDLEASLNKPPKAPVQPTAPAIKPVGVGWLARVKNWTKWGESWVNVPTTIALAALILWVTYRKLRSSRKQRNESDRVAVQGKPWADKK